MLVEVSSREGERGPITLDLLGGCTSVAPKDVDAGSKPSIGCRGDLRPLDLNRLPDDGPKPVAAAALAGSQSVCTIEKVKWALERAERESRGREMEEEQRRRRRRRRMGMERRRRRRRRSHEASDGCSSPSPMPSPSPSPSPSSSSSITTASIKRRGDGEDGSAGCDSAGGSLVAAGCPSCLSYVLISRMNPRCPRCDSQVAPPLGAAAAAPPAPQKRPRIDLNFALFPL